MEKKKFKKIKLEKANKIKEFKSHFGWVVKEGSEKAGKKKNVTSFILIRPKKKNTRILKKLEKQTKKIKKNFPTGAFIFSIIAGIFFFLGFNPSVSLDRLIELLSFISNTSILSAINKFSPIVCIIIGAFNAFYAIYLYIVFFTLLFNRKRLMKEILRNADLLSGTIIHSPLSGNIHPKNPDTGLLSKYFQKAKLAK